MVDVTVIVPTIPPRGYGSENPMLQLAMDSVGQQTCLPAGGVRLMLDVDGEGPAAMRDRALRDPDDPITTEYVTFLDDDDRMLPLHIETMWAAMQAPGVVMAYPWPVTVGGTNPHEANFGKPFDLEHPVQTTIVTMVRTDVAREVGFRTLGDLGEPGRLYGGEDWDFTQRVAAWCLEHDVRPGVVHIPERTWLWYHHGSNTSGLPRNWRADT